MCGIAGYLSFGHHRPASVESLRRLTAPLVHRGPDQSGSYVDRGLALGAQRLSIVDLANGRQPIASADGRLVLVCNGEIYNHVELRHELDGRYPFMTGSDSEVVLAVYELLGPDALDRLNGMFAFALWDRGRGHLFCARDRAGQKPFYYAIDDDTFVFASEPKALLSYAPALREIETAAVARYLAHDYVPSPRTVFRRIARLPAGCSLTVDEGGTVRRERYWTLPAVAPGVVASASELRRLFDAAVARHARADVPVGIFLSGGLDSSSVVSSLAASGAVGRVKTFSVAIPEPGFDESRYAELVARHFGTEHATAVLTAGSFLATTEKVADIMDEPFSDSSIVASFFLASLASEQVKVVLGGDGSDELFAGYPSFIAHRLLHAPALGALLRRVEPPLRALLGRVPPSDANYGWDALLSLLLAGVGHAPEVANQLWLGSFGPGDPILSGGRTLGMEVLDDLAGPGHRRACSAREAVERALHFYFDRYLQDDILTKIDRASMAHSLEVRSPFLDRDMIDYVAGLDVAHRLRGWRTKVLLRDAMRSRVPAPILRRRKRGFSIPLARWFRRELSGFMRETLSRSTVKRQGFFDPDRVEVLVGEHLSGRRDHRRRLWSLLAFTLWYDRFGRG